VDAISGIDPKRTSGAIEEQMLLETFDPDAFICCFWDTCPYPWGSSTPPAKDDNNTLPDDDKLKWSRVKYRKTIPQDAQCSAAEKISRAIDR
jgi:hypothetical protein